MSLCKLYSIFGFYYYYYYYDYYYYYYHYEVFFYHYEVDLSLSQIVYQYVIALETMKRLTKECTVCSIP